ncbi:MAG: hypothetical protein HYZ42_03530, partial [Bacteroidetes bacterium]|nr:hypothetical protein [Bacteroidota bacterium]
GYTFTKFGKYSIELYLRSTTGCSDSTINTDYYVLGPPKPKMFFSNKKPCPGEEVTVNDVTSAFSPKGIWQFRRWTVYDRDFKTILYQDTLNKVKYKFQDTGHYKVKLVVYNVLGCIDSLSDSTSIYVTGTVVDFTIDKTHVCRNEAFKLEASTNSTSIGTTYGWDIVNEDDSIYTYIEGNKNPLNKTVGGVGRYSIRCTAYTKACTTSVLKRLVLSVSGVMFKGVQDTLYGCNPVKFKLSSSKIYNYQSSGNDSGLSFQWYSTPGGAVFLDSFAASTDVTFPLAGCYGVTLLTTNIDGCQSNWLNVINTCIGNNADFNMEKGKCLGDSIKPINTSSSFSKSFYWKVTGPSNNVKILPSDTSTNPVIYADKTGQYEVKLYVTTNIGCVDSISKFIDVVKPQAQIYSADSIGFCGPHLVSFTYTGTPASSYTWYWGDGSNPLVTSNTFLSHVYDIKNGKSRFNVSVVIVDQYGCKDSTSFPSFVRINGPVPFFTIDQSKGCDPLNITFENKTKGAAKVIFYDDNGLVDSSNSAQYKRTFRLKQPGDTISSYYPFMIASDSSGLCTKAYKSLDTILVFKKPTASFTFNDSLICINDLVTFTNTSIDANKIYWDFNMDNIIEDSISPRGFRYTKKGYYYPKLIAINRGGCPDTMVAAKPVEVFPVVKGVIYASKLNLCQGDTIQLFTSTDTVYPYRLTYKWYIYNNKVLIDSSTDVYPKKLYTQIGSYSANVVVTNVAGCSDTLFHDSLFFIKQKEPYKGTNINYV